MFKVIILCVLATAFAENYSDLVEIIKNKRILQAYANCLLEKQRCSPEGKELKEDLVQAIETGCDKCSDTQKEGMLSVAQYLIENEPDIWNELITKYDSTGIWRKTYEGEARKNGIVLPNHENK